MSMHRLVTHALVVLAVSATPATFLLAVAETPQAGTALDELARDVDRTESVRAVMTLQRSYAQYAQSACGTRSARCSRRMAPSSSTA